jgi:hypothetical protein
MAHRVVAVIADRIGGPEAVEQLRAAANGSQVELRLVAAPVEASPFRHTMGDVDEPKREADANLEASLAGLRDGGFELRGRVGDPDPIQAAQDALLEEPADEVVFFERAESDARWFEEDLEERAEEMIEAPLRVVQLESAPPQEPPRSHVVDVETSPAGTIDHAEHDVGASYIPGLSRSDFTGMCVGVVGTILAIVLAAAAGAQSNGPEVGWNAVGVGAAIAVALINMAHVVGLLLMESVGYRGGFARFFRTLSLVLTPAAVLLNLIILLS